MPLPGAGPSEVADFPNGMLKWTEVLQRNQQLRINFGCNKNTGCSCPRTTKVVYWLSAFQSLSLLFFNHCFEVVHMVCIGLNEVLTALYWG